MAENLVIDVHFKAYHFEKTAEKGMTTEVNTNAVKSIVRLVLKGRQQMFNIYVPKIKYFCSILTTFRCSSEV
jgi:hypothetical protein